MIVYKDDRNDDDDYDEGSAWHRSVQRQTCCRACIIFIYIAPLTEGDGGK